MARGTTFVMCKCGHPHEILLKDSGGNLSVGPEEHCGGFDVVELHIVPCVCVVFERAASAA